jgi:tetratricopeptide (TPR) repeat protein
MIRTPSFGSPSGSRRHPALVPALVLCLSLTGLPSATAPALSQQATPDADERTPAQRFADALRTAESGDIGAAIVELEALRQLPEAPPAVAGILGALYVEIGEMEKGYELLQPIAESEAANPATLYHAGRAAVALGDVENAVAYLARSVEMEPDSPASRELGLLMGSLGSFGEGYRFLLPWVRQNPDDQTARMAAAIGAIELERASEAEELLSELDASEDPVKLLWGQLLLLKGDPWGAIGNLKPMLDSAPDAMQRDLRYVLADAYLTVGESEQAVEVLESDRVRMDPRIALRLSRAQLQSGDAEAALATLQPFAEPLLDPETRAQVPPPLAASLALDYGSLLHQAGRSKEALPLLRFATEVGPDVQRAWQTLGQALAAAGQRDEAQAALERFRELSEANERAEAARSEADLADPTGRELREVMMLMAEGNDDQALRRLEREIELNPEDPRPRLLASRVLLRLEQPEAALEAAMSIVEQMPDNVEALYMVGAARMALEDTDAAEQTLRRVIELAPDYTPAMNDLAVLLIASDRTDEARALLQRVLEIRPDDAVAQANLQQLEN